MLELMKKFRNSSVKKPHKGRFGFGSSSVSGEKQFPTESVKMISILRIRIHRGDIRTNLDLVKRVNTLQFPTGPDTEDRVLRDLRRFLDKSTLAVLQIVHLLGGILVGPADVLPTTAHSTPSNVAEVRAGL